VARLLKILLKQPVEAQPPLTPAPVPAEAGVQA
jgi:hypothetical protein